MSENFRGNFLTHTVVLIFLLADFDRALNCLHLCRYWYINTVSQYRGSPFYR